MGAVEDYIRYYGAHQWQQLRTVFDASDFKRTGPYLDVFTDVDKYVDFRFIDEGALGVSSKVDQTVTRLDQRSPVQFVRKRARIGSRLSCRGARPASSFEEDARTNGGSDQQSGQEYPWQNGRCGPENTPLAWSVMRERRQLDKVDEVPPIL